MGVTFDYASAAGNIRPDRLATALNKALELQRNFLADSDAFPSHRGWVDPDTAAGPLAVIKEKAAEIRENAEVFVLVGVGGSNQAARAVIRAIPVPGAPEVLYAGNNLSPDYLARLLTRLGDRKVYVNVIAKNFATLEPGIHYRVLRRHLARVCGPKELAQRFILTGTPGEALDRIAKEKNHLFLPFPPTVGGRFSALTPVGLFPMAAAGLDLDRLLAGARDLMERLRNGDDIAARYAALRNLLFQDGFRAEMLAAFEPRLTDFGGWWLQLFGESEGKDGTGILPVRAAYSEDLHAIGQFVQHGSRMLMETFLSVEEAGAVQAVLPDPDTDDGFDYLNGKDFVDLNRAAEAGTLAAHDAGGVPCMRFTAGRIDEYHFGQLFQLFLVSCTVSALFLGVHPFEQDGVEEYKNRMFAMLGRPGF